MHKNIWKAKFPSEVLAKAATASLHLRVAAVGLNPAKQSQGAAKPAWQPCRSCPSCGRAGFPMLRTSQFALRYLGVAMAFKHPLRSRRTRGGIWGRWDSGEREACSCEMPAFSHDISIQFLRLTSLAMR